MLENFNVGIIDYLLHIISSLYPIMSEYFIFKHFLHPLSLLYYSYLNLHLKIENIQIFEQIQDILELKVFQRDYITK